MNIIRKLRLERGIQQKELAIEVGVSNATVSDWEHGRKKPSGERLRKLADFFGVDPPTILGERPINENKEEPFPPPGTTVTVYPETEKIVQYVLDKLNAPTEIKTPEAKLLARGVDKMSQEQREQALAVVKAMFAQYDYFDGGNEDET